MRMGEQHPQRDRRGRALRQRDESRDGVRQLVQQLGTINAVRPRLDIGDR